MKNYDDDSNNNKIIIMIIELMKMIYILWPKINKIKLNNNENINKKMKKNER